MGHDVALFLFIVKNTFISGGEQFHHRIYHLIKCAAFGGAAIGSVVNHAIPAKWGIIFSSFHKTLRHRVAIFQHAFLRDSPSMTT